MLIILWKFSSTSIGYEIKFEAEGGVTTKKGAQYRGPRHNPKDNKKEEEEDDEEEESNASDHKTEWGKLSEKIGGYFNQATDKKSGGGSSQTKNKQQTLDDSEEEAMCTDIIQVEAESSALQIMPLAYSYPSSDLVLVDQFSQESFGEKLEEGLDQCAQ